MSNAAGEEESSVVLSDLEEDDDNSPAPMKLAVNSSEPEISVEKFNELLAEYDREKKARIAIENSKSELDVRYNRLKLLAREAIKKRDECTNQRDEAIKERDEIVSQRDDAIQANEKLSKELMEVNKAKEEVSKQLEEALKGKDTSRAEIEAAAQMLVTGIEKISGKVSHIKNFSGGGLPRSQKYTGLPAVAYGVIKRTNDIVEEMLKQVDSMTKSRNEAREMVEQRNYEIAIEVSELEATISQLRDEVGEKSSQIEGLEKCIVEKDGKLEEIEGGMTEKIGLIENEREELRKLVDGYEGRIRDLELQMEKQRPLLIEQLAFVSKIHDQLYNVIKIVDANNGDQSEFSESLFLPQETGLEENIRASLAGLESIHELSRIVIAKTREVLEEKSHEVKSLNETVARLFREKEHVGVLLRSALSKRLTSGSTTETNAVFQVAENGLREAGIDFKFSHVLEDASKEGSQETKDDEIYALAGALESIIKESHLQILELQHSIEELRAESSLLKEHLETQSKELSLRKLRIEELEEKERQANENIEGLMIDIAAAEEEITRWKVAAEQEAAAGRAVEQEFLAQISSFKQDAEETKQAMLELEKKLKFKEETATAAMAAREAAEKSLRLADTRASRLRDRVEELTRQLENLDIINDSRNSTRPRYVCWPWEWLGIDFVGMRRQIDMPQQQGSNEMELSEPLL
ncbi:uncharacterized protein At3g49055 [Amaranthus tricolor]|uniref:uncharacterized protein At3g49055 n=1 Tax=Amaranthus tricolor TaxID=29722 RepID=UPI002586C596|nr:uncharacterized protein At3g49055 [Amaranthus tricolor]